MKKLFTYLIFLTVALILYNTNAVAKETVRTAVHIISYSNGSGGISALRYSIPNYKSKLWKYNGYSMPEQCEVLFYSRSNSKDGIYLG